MKNCFLSSLSRLAGYSSSSGRTEDHCLDQQIQELNQELEGVFGPCDDDKSARLFSSPPTSLQFHEQSLRVDTTKHKTCAFVDAQRTISSRQPFHNTNGLSHVDTHGKASMVNVSDKLSSKRVAIASGKVTLGPTAFLLVSANQISKGDVLTVAKIAGICGAKQTGNLIPLCHNISLSNVQMNLELDDQESAVIIKAEATAVGATGVEMEALTAVSIAALTVYDMCKAVSKHVSISNIQLESKTGGKSGDWCRSKE